MIDYNQTLEAMLTTNLVSGISKPSVELLRECAEMVLLASAFQDTNAAMELLKSDASA